MRGVPALGSPSSIGMLGVLRSWLRARSSDIWQSSAILPSEIDRPNGANGNYNRSVRVLVVDDNPVNLMVMSAMLESRGLVPVLAADGAEAVTLACELHFDVILMDLQMPILDGLRATSAIRRFETSRSQPAVPVVAYSSASPGAGVLATHGFNGSLTKPCEEQELEDCLVQWCPAYRPAPTVSDAAHDSSCWQPANRISGASSASLR